jgi:hypothetical protein
MRIQEPRPLLCVYSLYGLTREEIAIIEDSLQERTAGKKTHDIAEVGQPT